MATLRCRFLYLSWSVGPSRSRYTLVHSNSRSVFPVVVRSFSFGNKSKSERVWGRGERERRVQVGRLRRWRWSRTSEWCLHAVAHWQRLLVGSPSKPVIHKQTHVLRAHRPHDNSAKALQNLIKNGREGLMLYMETHGDVSGNHVMTCFFYRDLKYRNNEILNSQGLDDSWTYSETDNSEQLY